MDGEKDSLIGKAKSTHTSKAKKKKINSLLSMSREVFSQESRAPLHMMVIWEANTIDLGSKYFTLSSPPHFIH